MKEEKEKKKNVWNYILIVVVILGIIVGYLSYLQDKKMDKMEEELDRTKMEQKTTKRLIMRNLATTTLLPSNRFNPTLQLVASDRYN